MQLGCSRCSPSTCSTTATPSRGLISRPDGTGDRIEVDTGRQRPISANQTVTRTSNSTALLAAGPNSRDDMEALLRELGFSADNVDGRDSLRDSQTRWRCA